MCPLCVDRFEAREANALLSKRAQAQGGAGFIAADQPPGASRAPEGKVPSAALRRHSFHGGSGAENSDVYFSLAHRLVSSKAFSSHAGVRPGGPCSAGPGESRSERATRRGASAESQQGRPDVPSGVAGFDLCRDPG